MTTKMPTIKDRLFQNFAWLSFLQIFNYAAPLLVLPYLARQLSVADFGAFSVVMATIALAFVMTDYGFSLSATYRISKNRDNKSYIEKLIGRIFSAKIFLNLFGFFLIIIISEIPAYSHHKEVFMVGVIAMVAQSFHSAWLYQGLERLKFYTIYMSVVKVLYVVFVFSLIKNDTSPVAILWCWSVSNAIGMVISLRNIQLLGFKIKFAGFREGWCELKDSSSYFYSRIALAIYSTACTVILGTTSLQQAAIYTTAENGLKAGQAFTSSIAQALYPYMARERDWLKFKLVVIFGLSILTMAAISISLNAADILTLVFGAKYSSAGEVLVIMMLILVVNFLNVVFGYPAYAAIDQVEVANITIILGCIVFIVCLIALYLSALVTPVSIAFLVLSIEVLVFFLRFTFLMIKLNRR